MERCPICRALLNGADTCRRCRAELGSVIGAERQAKRLLGEAMYRLTLQRRALNLKRPYRCPRIAGRHHAPKRSRFNAIRYRRAD